MYSLTLHAERPELLTQARALLSDLSGLTFEEQPETEALHPVLEQLLQKSMEQSRQGLVYTNAEVFELLKDE